MSTRVNPIPDGLTTITPHLVVREAVKAIDFYKRAFGAEEVSRVATPDGKSIMHADLKIGNAHIFLVDEMPGMECRGPQSLGGTPVTIHMYVPDVDKAFERAVAAGAEVRMPVADMFWGDRYGIVADPFGHSWSIATHKEDVSVEEIMKRAEAACGKG
jgi:PhnB protein